MIIKAISYSKKGDRSFKPKQFVFDASRNYIFSKSNGTGKSTLASVIMGKKNYEVTGGDILLDNESILPLQVDERARKGIFLAYQYPEEVNGVTNSDFVRQAMKACTGKDVNLFTFIRKYETLGISLGSRVARTESAPVVREQGRSFYQRCRLPPTSRGGLPSKASVDA